MDGAPEKALPSSENESPPWGSRVSGVMMELAVPMVPGLERAGLEQLPEALSPEAWMDVILADPSEVVTLN